MKSRSKILATAVAAAIAASTISLPAFANDKKPGAIVPALAGPVAVAASISATKQVPYLIVKDFYFKIWDYYGWQQYKLLKNLGFRVSKEIIHKKIVHVHAAKRVHTTRTNSTQGKAVVGCIMGSAFGAITASMRKATALGNPPRWRSQAEHEAIVKSGVEKKYELTSDEAATALALCGLGSFALHWPKAAPAKVVVKAKY